MLINLKFLWERLSDMFHKNSDPSNKIILQDMETWKRTYSVLPDIKMQINTEF